MKRIHLPIKVDATSNGEFAPAPVSPLLTRAKQHAVALLTDNARRVGLSRRDFLTSLCGAATTLLTFNAANASIGNTGGRYDLHRDAGLDVDLAAQTLGGDDFIFDIQTHLIDPAGSWRSSRVRAGMEGFLKRAPQGSCGEDDPVVCFDAEHYFKEVFLDSDTDVAVLSFVPIPAKINPTTPSEVSQVRDLVAGLEGSKRLLLHSLVLPNQPPYKQQLESMEQAAAEWDIAAWKVYTQWGPDGVGWALDDPQIGIPFIEKARELGIKNICIHKGFPLPGLSPKFTTAEDVGRVATMFPDVNFLIYHSGFEMGRREGPYDPQDAERGVSALVKSLQDNEVAPNQNVYAELGSTWRFAMRDPTAAAHVLGKLLRYVGQDRVVWGTDSIWYGSPQDQILAFRAFQIAPELQERHGYPALTPALKRKVFGINASGAYGIDPQAFRREAKNDVVGRARTAYARTPNPSFQTYGPRTTREFLALLKQRGGRPD